MLKPVFGRNDQFQEAQEPILILHRSHAATITNIFQNKNQSHQTHTDI